MEYWIAINREKEGPLTEEQIAMRNLPADTLCWREGLDSWIPVSEVPELAHLFAEKPEEADAEVTTPPAPSQPVIVQAPPIPQQPQPVPQPPMQIKLQAVPVTCPPTYLVWAILSTLCCCLPCGIAAIIYASNVKTKFNGGDIEGAMKYSERAALWVILSFVLGLISLPFQMIFSLI